MLHDQDDIYSLALNHDYRICQLKLDNTYKPFSKKRKHRAHSGGKSLNATDITTELSGFDEDHLCFNSSFVFTGTLESMVRRGAMQKVVDHGGSCENNVTKTRIILL
ncbi:hypothetical protein [Alkalibacillus silvisoli]